MAEFSPELQEKIQRVLGINPEALKDYDPAEIIDELCETAIMLDENSVLARITSLREKLTAINARIWNLLGKHDPKRARENLSGITELERYVGDLKRKIEEAKKEPEEPEVKQVKALPVREEDERRLKELEKRVEELQSDIENLVHMAMEIGELSEEARGTLAEIGAELSPKEKEKEKKE